jgi:glyoxylase-like metal-dependent hydrolase (beta-lactamase superfamily II)
LRRNLSSICEHSLRSLSPGSSSPIQTPDKFNGASVFKKYGAKLVASKATEENIPAVHAYKKYFFVEIAKMFTPENYPQPSVLDETFEKGLTIKLKGSESIELTEYNLPGVSLNQTVALLPKGLGLVVGDLVHHKAHAWLEGGIVGSKPVPTLQSWIQVLKEIRKNFSPNLPVLGGRGQTAPLKTAIPAQIDYLIRSEKLVDAYLSGLGGKK